MVCIRVRIRVRIGVYVRVRIRVCMRVRIRVCMRVRMKVCMRVRMKVCMRVRMKVVFIRGTRRLPSRWSRISGCIHKCSFHRLRLQSAPRLRCKAGRSLSVHQMMERSAAPGIRWLHKRSSTGPCCNCSYSERSVSSCCRSKTLWRPELCKKLRCFRHGYNRSRRCN